MPDIECMDLTTKPLTEAPALEREPERSGAAQIGWDWVIGGRQPISLAGCSPAFRLDFQLGADAATRELWHRETKRRMWEVR